MPTEFVAIVRIHTDRDEEPEFVAQYLGTVLEKEFDIGRPKSIDCQEDKDVKL